MNLSPSWQRRLIWLIRFLLLTAFVAAVYTLVRWYQDGGGFEVVYLVVALVLGGLWAVYNRLHGQQSSAWTNTAYSLPASGTQLPALARQIQQVYSLEDLRLLSFNMGLSYDDLAGATLGTKIVSLLEASEKSGRLSDLLQQLRTTRPHVQWIQLGTHDSAVTLPHARTRANFINQIRTIWIDGFLQQSLHAEVISLTMSYRPDAVNQRPWRLVLQQGNLPGQPVTRESSLMTVFTSSGRSLLILGKPGSGKTITMLQLAEDLLLAAEQDANEPIPIILNLSAWAQTKVDLSEWLVEEIFAQYGLKRELCRAWIVSNQLLYLLDGLDEVVESARDACIVAINEFKAEHSAEMVVCSRSEDYEKLNNRLHMGAAVQIQPLNEVQVSEYLAQGGQELKAVRASLASDTALRQLATEPLMLSMMVLAYQGASPVSAQAPADKEARRRHVFDTYVRRMFIHRPLPKDSPYSEQRALGWLKMLAAGMMKQNESIFYIDGLQPSWLPADRYRQYKLISTLLFGFIYSVIFSLLFVPPGGLRSWLIGGLSYALETGLPYGLVGGLIGFPFGVLSGVRSNGLLYPYVARIGPFAEELSWTLPSYRKLWRETGSGLLFGLIGSLIGMLLFSVLGSPLGGLVGGLLFGLFASLFTGLFAALQASIRSNELPQRARPNQGIYYARKNAVGTFLIIAMVCILMGLVLGITVGALIAMLIGGFTRWLLNGLVGGLLLGIPLGLFSGLLGGTLKYGGESIVQHYTLRYLLSRAKILPFPFRDSHLVAYLDAMKERIFLRRVGGGWIFIHRSFMEHFAQLADEDFVLASPSIEVTDPISYD
jgi:DNA polymerase III delta prime subunit